MSRPARSRRPKPVEVQDVQDVQHAQHVQDVQHAHAGQDPSAGQDAADGRGPFGDEHIPQDRLPDVPTSRTINVPPFPEGSGSPFQGAPLIEEQARMQKVDERGHEIDPTHGVVPAPDVKCDVCTELETAGTGTLLERQVHGWKVKWVEGGTVVLSEGATITLALHRR